MSDNLRDRIAAVIESIRIQRDGDAARMADAVIRALEDDYILVPKGHTIARIRSAEKLGLTGDGE